MLNIFAPISVRDCTLDILTFIGHYYLLLAIFSEHIELINEGYVRLRTRIYPWRMIRCTKGTFVEYNDSIQLVNFMSISQT